jgi:pyrimidine-nucleoside phosphorylase
MVNIAELADRKAVALLSDMNQPLGRAVGNALEVIEAIDALQGNGPESLVIHCLDVAEQMLILGKIAKDEKEAREIALSALEDGSAWQRFVDLVEAQGGDLQYIEHPDQLPQASVIKTVQSPQPGYLSQINARIVGETAVTLGAGREKKGDPIDHGVGIEVLHEVGDRVEKGEDLFVLHAKSQSDFESAKKRLLEAHQWSEDPVEPLPLVYEIVR